MNEVEAYQEYEETLDRINKNTHEAKEVARAILRERLETLRNNLHNELKVLRTIEQKTRRSRQ